MPPVLLLPALLAALGLPPVSCRALERPGGDEGEGGAFSTTVYLSEEEALQVVFPDAHRIVAHELVLSPDEMQAVRAELDRPLRQRRFRTYLGVTGDGRLDGYAVIQSEIGKFKPFDFIAGVEPGGEVRRVAVLVYREARGEEVAQRRFLVQYEGKTVEDPIDKNRDIINVQGATMSVDALNHGVKKVLAVVDVAYRRQPGRVRSLVEEPDAGAVGGAPRGPRPPPVRPAEARSNGLHEVREARYVMGTLFEIRAYGEEPRPLRRAVREAFDEIEAVDRALSDYRPGSEISRIGREAWRSPVPVSGRTARFLERADELARLTGGAIDITVGPLVDAWGLRAERPRRPRAEELRALRRVIGFEKLTLERLDDGRAAVRTARRGMRLDPGALGKGYALDRAAERLRRAGVDAALLDATSSALAIGAPPGEDAWSVAVRDPARPERLWTRVELRDRALAASGALGQRIEVGGEVLGHILSPWTLAPVRGVEGSVVVAPDATSADALATAACVLGEDAIAVLERRPRVDGVVVLTGDGTPRRRATAGWSGEVVPEALAHRTAHSPGKTPSR